MERGGFPVQAPRRGNVFAMRIRGDPIWVGPRGARLTTGSEVEPRKGGRMGGQMAETTQKQRRAGTRRKTKKAVPSASKKNAPGSKVAGGGVTSPEVLARRAKKPKQSADRAVEDGFEQLRKALGEELQRNGRRIAASLREQSVSGDMRSTKMMVELAVQKGSEKLGAKKKKKKSTALALGAEPEWTGEAKAQGQGEGLETREGAEKSEG